MMNDQEKRASLALLKGLHQANTQERERLDFILSALDEARETLYLTAARAGHKHAGLAQTLEQTSQLLTGVRQKAQEMDTDARASLQFLETLMDEREHAQGTKR